MNAIRHNRLSTVEYLVKMGADVKNNNYEPIRNACMNTKSIPLIKILLSKAPEFLEKHWDIVRYASHPIEEYLHSLLKEQKETSTTKLSKAFKKEGL
jgi:hypothetical protein